MPAAAQRTLAVQLAHFHLQLVFLEGRRLAGYIELPLEPASTLPARLDALLADDAPAPLACASASFAPRILHFDAARRTLRVEISPAALQTARRTLAAWDHAPADYTDATLALVDAIARSRPDAPVLVWDLSPADSRLILVDAQGPRALVPCPVSLDHVLEAVQTELKLRFRGAAIRLFASDTYDYNESGPTIANQLAPRLHSLLGELDVRPSTFCIAGLGRDQTWFTLALCDALHLAPWSPAWPDLATALALDPGALATAPACPASAAGLLHLAATTASAHTPASAQPAAPAPSPALSSIPTAPAPVRSPAAAPAPTHASAPLSVPPSRPASRQRALLAAALVFVLLVAGGALYLHRTHQQHLAREAAAAETARLATEARLAAETRVREQAAAKAAALAAEEAERQAEQDALARALARARLPGRIALGAQPPGTLIAINEQPVRPATPVLENLSPGEYRLTFIREGHEPAMLKVTVRADATTEIAPVKLTPKPATLDLSGAAPDLRYELRAASASRSQAAPLLAGLAPARLTDLPAGDYELTYLREGWRPRVLTLRLAPGETLSAPAPAFATGRVVLHSEPAGALVSLDGLELGRTPLALDEREPAALSFDLTLAGYDPAKIGGRVEPGLALELNATLDALDRIVPAAELSQMPRPIHQPSPELPARILRSGGLAILSLVIDREGVPGNIRVQQTDNNELARLCSETLAQWRFSPGLTHAGAPANVRVLVPFVVNAR